MRSSAYTNESRPAAVWNAARCSRLLRPLQNRLAALRRPGILTALSEEVTPEESPQRRAKRRLEAGAPTQRKRHTKTYSRRSATSTEPSVHGTASKDAIKRGIATATTSKTGLGSSIVTPLLRRAKFLHVPPAVPPRIGQIITQRSDPMSGKLAPGKHLITCLRNLAAHRTGLEEARYGIYEGILRDCNAILSATRAVKTAGAKSLLAMCLRQVPGRVAIIASQERGVAGRAVAAQDEVPDTFTRIYDELEGLGQGAAGWKHLSVVVKSHALWLLQDATRNGLLPPCMVSVLAGCYGCYGYHEDALSLLEALATKPCLGPQDPQSTFQGHGNMELLSNFADASDTTSPHAPDVCLLRLMLRSRKLPVAWLSTRGFQPCWARLTVSLASGHLSTIEQELFQAAIAALCSSLPTWPYLGPKETVPEDHTLVAVVGAMVSMALIAPGSFDPQNASKDASPGHRQVRKRMLRIFWGAWYEARNHDARPHALAILRLGIFFLVDQSRRRSMGRIVHQPEGPQIQSTTSDKVCELAATLICSITRCSSRALSCSAHIFHYWLCDQLEAGQVLTHKAIRGDAAFMLARETSDLRDLVFAEAVRSATARQPGTDQNRSNAQHTSAFAGYRWEEGISEWVLTSPAARKRATIGLNPAPTWTQCDKSVPGRRLRGQHSSGTAHGLEKEHNAQCLRQRTHDGSRQRHEPAEKKRGPQLPLHHVVDDSQLQAGWELKIAKDLESDSAGLRRAPLKRRRLALSKSLLQVRGGGPGGGDMESEDELQA
ncbi:hypothetical protein F5X68DRAFT_178546 [Plectosphaerella plurivora]|uniref:Uncharacterized protein n=1 Tax=Plectosphaerella plurivora TaxID=936078 RepID=A0A9P8V119_9PEZI|nr:hypothetical protein F5X68DRAFT_178546 [Plectosphaerella plurivora]